MHSVITNKSTDSIRTMLPSTARNITCDTDIKGAITFAGEDVDARTLLTHSAAPWASQGQAKTITNRAAFLWQKFPKFVLGFLLISILATYQFFNKEQITALANLSRWAFLLTFAGVSCIRGL